MRINKLPKNVQVALNTAIDCLHNYGFENNASILTDYFEKKEKPKRANYKNIIVNSKYFSIDKEFVTYNYLLMILNYGFSDYYTITYYNGGIKTPSGTLISGGKIKLIDGMIFNVMNTSNN